MSYKDDMPLWVYFMALMIVWIPSTIISGFTWPYVVESWANYLQVEINDVKFWHGMLIGLFVPLTPIGVMLAILTFVCMAVLIV